MTADLLENVQVYMFSQAVTRYCMTYFDNSLKIGTCISNKSYAKNSDFENLKNLFSFHGLL